MCGESDVLTEDKVEILREAVGQVVEWFQRAIRVRWSVSSALKLTGRATCGHDGGKSLQEAKYSFCNNEVP